MSDPPPTKPAVRQPTPEPARDLPSLLTAPGGRHPAFDALRPQEKNIFLGVVVASCAQARASHADKAVDDRPSGFRRRKKDHIAGAWKSAAIRPDLENLRIAKRRIHAGAGISGIEYGPGDVPATIRQRHEGQG